MSIGRKRPPRFRAGDHVVFLYGPQKVAGEIVEDRGPLGDYGRRLYRVRINRGEEDENTFEIMEEDIEVPNQSGSQPETAGLRQEFDVTYIRRDETNHWKATTTQGRLYKGVKARGAVGYTTARREGERDGDENHATVTVFMECDESMRDSHDRVRSTAWPVMTAAARQFADQMFKNRHPDAVIDHVD
jgi:hypothetical protein